RVCGDRPASQWCPEVEPYQFFPRLRAAFADVTCDGGEIVHRTADDISISVSHRLCEQASRLGTCSFNAEQRRIGQLPLLDIFPGGLPEGRRALFDVEQVVDDLEREAGRLAVTSQRRELIVGRAGEQAAEDDGGREELAGLVAMNEDECFQCASTGCPFHVRDLA